MVYLAGWAYKPYIHVIKSLPTSNTVIGFDNQYAGTLRQQLGILYFRLTLKPYIKSAFVPGLQQHTFAKKLGFKEEHIELLERYNKLVKNGIVYIKYHQCYGIGRHYSDDKNKKTLSRNSRRVFSDCC